MIHEFALEPGLLHTWERFRYLTEKFGVCQGRLISRYPKRWKAMVYESLRGCTEIERKKIEVRLQAIDDKLVTRPHEWDRTRNWLANAEAEHSRHPFHAIIAAANPRELEHVLIYDDLEETTPLWCVERGRVIARKADALAVAVTSLVALGRTVIFIDPHFSPYKAKARNTLKAFLVAVVQRRNTIPVEHIEFHTAYKEEMRDFVAECERQLPQRIPAGLSIRIVRWRERPDGEGLHNRYILTDRGGVQLAWGLDEGKPAHTDDISLLEPGVYTRRWAQYCGEKPAFELIDELVIVGKAVSWTG